MRLRDEHWNKRLLSAMTLLLLASQAEAANIMVVVTNTIGQTEALWGSIGYIIEGPQVQVDAQSFNSGGISFAGYTYTYRYYAYIDNSDVPTLYATRADVYSYYIANNIDKQPEGFFDYVDDLLDEFVRDLNRNNRLCLPDDPDRCVTWTAGGGSVTRTYRGRRLVEQSPDAEVELLKDVVVADLTSFKVPFLVESKGDEDWIELTMNDQVFFRRALSEFTAGSWYAADVPLSLMRDGDNLIGYGLYSEGEANSSVFFPTAVVPLPGAVWLLGTALAGLAGRSLLRRKATANLRQRASQGARAAG